MRERWVERRRRRRKMCGSRSLYSTLKLPRSKSPFNEKTIFVETERDRETERMEGFQIHTRALFAREWEIKALQRLPSHSHRNGSTASMEELLCNLICYKTISVTALGIWAKKLAGSSFSSVRQRDPLLLFMPRNRSGHIPPSPPPTPATLVWCGCE